MMGIVTLPYFFPSSRPRSSVLMCRPSAKVASVPVSWHAANTQSLYTRTSLSGVN